jgi:hypothetical protein
VKKKAPKMVNLSINETSGVDHPAHLHEGWMVMKAADAAEVEEIMTSLTTETPDEVSGDEGTKEDSMPEEITEAVEAPVAEEAVVVEEATDALKAAEARIAELEDALAKATTAPVEAAAEVEPTGDDLLKAAPEAVVKMVEDLRKAADEAFAKAAAAEAELTAERDARADALAIEKARGWSNLSLDADQVGPALRRLAAMDEDLAKAIEGVLTSVNAQAESANIFAEIGKSAGSVEGSAVDRLTAIAKSAVESGTAASFEQAFANAVTTNPDLYTEYLSEKGA